MSNLINPPGIAIGSLQTILDSLASGNYDLFATVGNSAYKAGITKQMFEGVSEQLAPRMEQGYSIVYFGHLKQRDYQVYLWRLSFADGGDEFVTRMTMDGDKVAGILIT